MPDYLYYCSVCNYSFEVKKSMYESSRLERCPLCRRKAQRKYTPLPFSFGFKLTDASQERFGPKNEVERDV